MNLAVSFLDRCIVFPSSLKVSIDGIHVAEYLDEKIGEAAIERLEDKIASFINPDCCNHHGWNIHHSPAWILNHLYKRLCDDASLESIQNLKYICGL